jgi:hypothetical protein
MNNYTGIYLLWTILTLRLDVVNWCQNGGAIFAILKHHVSRKVVNRAKLLKDKSQLLSKYIIS